MAFLDNSGDIILDAVLTDTGRLRLAQGDGSFKIAKFALGDDEINYGLYNKNHASGSAYYDLEILQTPILEAFTNNSGQIKSKLMTMNRTNVLYMPTLRLNQVRANDNDEIQAGSSKFFRRMGNMWTNTTTGQPGYTGQSTTKAAPGNPKLDNSPRFEGFYVAVDADTHYALTWSREAGNTGAGFQLGPSTEIDGVLMGYTPSVSDPGSTTDAKTMIRVDQGLNTVQISPQIGMDSDLLETAYIVEMDYRLGRVKATKNADIAPVNFIDDDNIATYYLTDNKFVNPYPGKEPYLETRSSADAYAANRVQTHQGPRGSTLHFRIQASAELQSSTYLFEQLGFSEAIGVGIDSTITGLQNGDGDSDAGTDAAVNGKTTYWLDTAVRVIGANTGARIDIPVRFIKIQ